jgi:predicted dehydrogenase
MIRHEDIEAVVIAVPLWAHADVASACMAAGKHVLCEKMMAWDEAGCLKMRQAALDNRRVLEIGYQRNYNQMYQAAHDGIVKAGLLGDVYMSRIAWHRNGNWRRQGTPPSKDYNPSKWGYPDFEHLWNWRLYNRYSRGLIAELASHELNIVNWFFAAEPTSVMGTGGVYRWKDGREVPDHVYVTWEYADGRTAVFSSVESNAFDHYYEAFFGTKGTLILQGEAEAYLFDEGTGKPATSIEVTPKGPGPALEASESRVADAAGRGQAGATSTGDRLLAYRNEISGFCSTVRTAHPLLCGPDRAMGSARACIAAVEAVTKKSRVEILPAPVART